MSEEINIPPIWLASSRELIRSYKPGFSQEEYSKFKAENEENKKEFESIINDFGDKILKEINNISGIPWFRKEIPIYLIPPLTTKKNFSHPLTLNWKDDTIRMVLFLIHELIHINLVADRDRFYLKDYNAKIKNPEIQNLEASIFLISEIVLKKVMKKEDYHTYEKELGKVLGFQERCNRRDVEKLKKQWDYKEINFRTFLNI
jgi:hypothetical protein